MDLSISLPATLSCATLALTGLMPAALAQGLSGVSQIEEGPRSLFESDSDDSLAKFLNWGALNARPHADVKAYYDSNLALRDSAEEEDLVWRISPGVMLGLGEFRGDRGNYVTLDYTLTGSIYTKYSTYNSIDHDAVLSAGWRSARFSADLSQSFVTGNGKQVEAGSFIDQQTFLTGLATKYTVSDKTFVQVNGRQSYNSGESIERNARNIKLPDINEWAAEAWLNYNLSEKFTVGAGPTVGWRDIHDHDTPNDVAAIDSPNQTFQQGMLKAVYLASEKVALNAAAGIQFSQFQGDEDNGPNFIAEFGATWKALENTEVSLNVYRRDQVSLSTQSQNYFVTGFRAALQQKIRERYIFTLQGGYENYDYYDTGANLPGPDRDDNYFWLSPVLAFQANERTQVGVFYQFRERESNTSGLDFIDNQIGLFAKYAF